MSIGGRISPIAQECTPQTPSQPPRAPLSWTPPKAYYACSLLTNFVQEGNFNPPHNIESIQHFCIKLTSLGNCWSGCPDNLLFVIVRWHRVAPKSRAKQRKSSTTKALSNVHNIARRYRFNTFEGATESLDDADHRGVSCQLSWQMLLAGDGYVRRDMLRRTVIVRSHCNSAIRTTPIIINNIT